MSFTAAYTDTSFTATHANSSAYSDPTFDDTDLEPFNMYYTFSDQVTSVQERLAKLETPGIFSNKSAVPA